MTNEKFFAMIHFLLHPFWLLLFDWIDANNDSEKLTKWVLKIAAAEAIEKFCLVGFENFHFHCYELKNSPFYFFFHPSRVNCWCDTMAPFFSPRSVFLRPDYIDTSAEFSFVFFLIVLELELHENWEWKWKFNLLMQNVIELYWFLEKVSLNIGILLFWTFCLECLAWK